MKIFISTSSFGKADQAPLDLLSAVGAEIGLNPFGRTMTSEEIQEHALGATGLIAGTEHLTRAVLEGLPGLKVISRVGIGMDAIDLDAAADLGITVTNTPDAPTDAVAELTLALILDTLKGVARHDRELRAGKWHKHIGVLLTGRTVGIIGFGRIGQRLAALLAPFSCSVIYYDIAAAPVAAQNSSAEATGFEELLKMSDVVSLHVPISRGSGHLIGENELKLMKKDAYLINAARGGLVDEKALYHMLSTGSLKGAALDTFEEEPYNGLFNDLDNVVLTSHIGSCAAECRSRMEQEAVRNLLESLESS